MAQHEEEYKPKRLGKIILLAAIVITALFFISQIIFLLISGFSSNKDEVAFFAGNHYSIINEDGTYRLYDKKTQGIILDNVNGYYSNNAVYSYIKNEDEYVVINEQEEEYIVREIDPNNQEEKALLKKFTPLSD
ncbi:MULTISPECIES: hypothetical protein [Bacillaceae]|uniref:hypothetical protein n=1 Tax=Bacillaceae TaxID=186817 RepID=UPI00105276A2|nr:hypothetical protein [Bacillus sp. CBEL-1]TDB53171.1 hypothetical protein EPL02_06645 [Bacillus sp. CBEL-1]